MKYFITGVVDISLTSIRLSQWKSRLGIIYKQTEISRPLGFLMGYNLEKWGREIL